MNGMATPAQMLAKGIPHGTPWIAHFGFWFLLLFLQPVLAWATAQMWPVWHDRAGIVALCMILGGTIGFFLQSWWSRRSGSSDAWSTNDLPNEAGIIHILHMSVEVGMMLMLLLSALWWREMPWPTFFGILSFVACHFLIGGPHWPLAAWWPDFAPAGMEPLVPWQILAYSAATACLLWGGFRLLIMGTLF